MILFILIAFAGLWVLFVQIAARVRHPWAKAAWRAAGPAVMFSPGVVVGHGVPLAPAVACILFESQLRGWNTMSFLVVYLIAFSIYLATS